MTTKASFARASALALPLGLVVSAAQAASLVDVAGKMDQLTTFNDAIAAAGLEDKLAGDGPFTVFAPTNEAFEQLPEGVLSKLFEEGHQAQLAKLLEHHMVDGKAVTAKDVVGRETEVDTVAGDQLTIDGTDRIVLVIPTGVTVARAGGQVVVEQRAAVAVAPPVAVESADQAATRTEVAEGSDMPATEHQQEVLRGEVDEETRQTAPQEGMPSTQHQEQVLSSDAGGQSQQGASATQDQQQAQQSSTGGQSQQTATTDSGMPASQHQQQALKSDGGEETRQTAQEGGMPATEHQQEVLAKGEQPAAGGDQAGQLTREASVVESDIEADNGVIHVIDAVIVPQELQETLEQLKGGA